MYRVYEIFEILQDGSPRKRACANDWEVAKSLLEELAKGTLNECFAADANTRQIVAHKNMPPQKWRSAKRIFQISYDEQMGPRRAELLAGLGYGVISAYSNQAAKLLLSALQHYDLFIVGHAAPEATRSAMVDWLREKYPKVKILALNPPNEQLSNADYNVLQNGPENWLPIVAEAA